MVAKFSSRSGPQSIASGRRKFSRRSDLESIGSGRRKFKEIEGSRRANPRVPRSTEESNEVEDQAETEDKADTQTVHPGQDAKPQPGTQQRNVQSESSNTKSWNLFSFFRRKPASTGQPSRNNGTDAPKRTFSPYVLHEPKPFYPDFDFHTIGKALAWFLYQQSLPKERQFFRLEFTDKFVKILKQKTNRRFSGFPGHLGDNIERQIKEINEKIGKLNNTPKISYEKLCNIIASKNKCDQDKMLWKIINTGASLRKVQRFDKQVSELYQNTIQQLTQNLKSLQENLKAEVKKFDKGSTTTGKRFHFFLPHLKEAQKEAQQLENVFIFFQSDLQNLELQNLLEKFKEEVSDKNWTSEQRHPSTGKFWPPKFEMMCILFCLQSIIRILLNCRFFDKWSTEIHFFNNSGTGYLDRISIPRFDTKNGNDNDVFHVQIVFQEYPKITCFMYIEDAENPPGKFFGGKPALRDIFKIDEEKSSNYIEELAQEMENNLSQKQDIEDVKNKIKQLFQTMGGNFKGLSDENLKKVVQTLLTISNTNPENNKGLAEQLRQNLTVYTQNQSKLKDSKNQSKKNNLEAEKDQLKAEKQKMATEKDELEIQLDNERNNFKAEKEKLVTEKEQLEKNLKDENTNLQTEIENLKSTEESIRLELVETGDLNKKLSDQIKQSEAETRNMQNKREELKTTLQNMFKDGNDILDNLKREVESLHESEKNQNATALSKNIKNIFLQLQDLPEMDSNTLKELQDMSKEKGNLQNILKKILDEDDISDDQWEDVEKVAKEMERLLPEVLAKHQQQKAELNEYQKNSQELEKHASELIDANKQIQQLQKEKTALENEKAKLEHERKNTEEISSRLTNVQGDLKTTKAARNALTIEKQFLQAKVQELEKSLQGKIKAESAQNSKANKKLSQILQSIMDEQVKLTETENALRQKQKEIEEAESRLKALREELTQAQKAQRSIRGKKVELKETGNALHKKQQEIDQATTKLTQLQQNLIKAETTIKEKTSEKENAEEKTEDVKFHVPIQEFPTTGEYISIIEQYLNGGTEPPNRDTITSFLNTSQKSQDNPPNNEWNKFFEFLQNAYISKPTFRQKIKTITDEMVSWDRTLEEKGGAVNEGEDCFVTTAVTALFSCFPEEQFSNIETLNDDLKPILKEIEALKLYYDVYKPMNVHNLRAKCAKHREYQMFSNGEEDSTTFFQSLLDLTGNTSFTYLEGEKMVPDATQILLYYPPTNITQYQPYLYPTSNNTHQKQKYTLQAIIQHTGYTKPPQQPSPEDVEKNKTPQQPSPEDVEKNKRTSQGHYVIYYKRGDRCFFQDDSHLTDRNNKQSQRVPIIRHIGKSLPTLTTLGSDAYVDANKDNYGLTLIYTLSREIEGAWELFD